MSGTSLDGLDLAYVEFSLGLKWSFELKSFQTVRYSQQLKHVLGGAHKLTATELMKLHTSYGNFIGKVCLRFIKAKGITKVNAIASHGHTIFHQPESGFTFQVGDGNAIHAITTLPVVFDFRSLDVTLGGQGAPLVPQGDRLLFPAYDACLNLGGIANVSMEVRGRRKAFDICFCNMALNFLMSEVGESHDKNGRTASNGSLDKTLLDAIQHAHRASRKGRLSIGRELFEKELQPLLSDRRISLPDRLRTVCEMIAIAVVDSLPRSGKPMKLLATGGGALNLFLIDLIRTKLRGKGEIVVPAKEIIEFKEALIFAFLGVLRLRDEINVLRSVTRASRDSCSGVLIGG